MFTVKYSRRLLSTLAVMVACLASSLALTGWLVNSLLLEPTHSGQAAHAIFSDTNSREALTAETTTMLSSALPGLTPEQLSTTTTTLFNDPEFATAVSDGVVAAHQTLLTSVPAQLPTSFEAPVRRALVASGIPPAQVAMVPADQLSFVLTPTGLPDVSAWVSRTHTMSSVARTVALVAWATAFLIAARRRRPAKALGRYLVVVGVFGLAVTLVVPMLLSNVSGVEAIPAAVVRAEIRPLWLPTLAIFAAGVALLVAVYASRRLSFSHTPSAVKISPPHVAVVSPARRAS